MVITIMVVMNYVRLVAVELLVGLFVGSRKFLAKKNSQIGNADPEKMELIQKKQ